MTSHSAFRCKTPGCRTLLGIITSNGRVFKTADEIEAREQYDGVIVVCPNCGAARAWLGPAIRRSEHDALQTRQDDA